MWEDGPVATGDRILLPGHPWPHPQVEQRRMVLPFKVQVFGAALFAVAALALARTSVHAESHEEGEPYVHAGQVARWTRAQQMWVPVTASGVFLWNAAVPTDEFEELNPDAEPDW